MSIKTERSAEDWKRLHDRLYDILLEQESEIRKLRIENARLNAELMDEDAAHTQDPPTLTVKPTTITVKFSDPPVNGL